MKILHYIPPFFLPANVQFELEAPCLRNELAVVFFNLKSAILRRFIKFKEGGGPQKLDNVVSSESA